LLELFKVHALLHYDLTGDEIALLPVAASPVLATLALGDFPFLRPAEFAVKELVACLYLRRREHAFISIRSDRTEMIDRFINFWAKGLILCISEA